MASDYIEQTVALRDDAWRTVGASPAFIAFKALDDAVAAMGGQRIIAPAPPVNKDGPRPSVGPMVRIPRGRTMGHRISQSDAAEAALLANSEPLPIGRLMEAALAKGAAIGGEKPLANFRSALSKDKRFYSLMRNGLYFWWLDGVELPDKWKEASDRDLLTESDASSVHSNQEGGDS